MKQHILVHKPNSSLYKTYTLKKGADLAALRQRHPEVDITECLCPPSVDELGDMVCDVDWPTATDGCRVDPDGHCPLGCPSWLLVFGLI